MGQSSESGDFDHYAEKAEVDDKTKSSNMLSLNFKEMMRPNAPMSPRSRGTSAMGMTGVGNINFDESVPYLQK